MSATTRAGDFLFISGQVAFDESGAVVGTGDPLAQAEQVFANIGHCLAEAGGQLSDLVRLTTYVTNESVYPPYAAVKTRLFQDARAPASTTVVVSALLHPQLLIEVDAVAYLPTNLP
jgi:enamine deaminase RidA (YjgF/YER057c/UK114 family)